MMDSAVVRTIIVHTTVDPGAAAAAAADNDHSDSDDDDFLRLLLVLLLLLMMMMSIIDTMPMTMPMTISNARQVLSQFLFDDHIRSRLLKDVRFFRDK